MAPHAYLGWDLPEGQPTQGDELTRLLVRFADGVVVAVVVAQRGEASVDLGAP